jgi:hypothetical protein
MKERMNRGIKKMTPDYKNGFDDAINHIIKHCDLVIGCYSKTEQELKAKKRLSSPFKFKAWAISDFKEYLEEMYKSYVRESENKE